MTLLRESSPMPLSALKGAHDSGDFNTTVETVSPTSPPLVRGATSLVVDPSTSVRAFEQRLKEINILLEKVPLLP